LQTHGLVASVFYVMIIIIFLMKLMSSEYTEPQSLLKYLLNKL